MEFILWKFYVLCHWHFRKYFLVGDYTYKDDKRVINEFIVKAMESLVFSAVSIQKYQKFFEKIKNLWYVDVLLRVGGCTGVF